MNQVTDKFNPNFIYDNSKDGHIVDFSVKAEEKQGFCGYYINAEADKNFSPNSAVEFSFECENLDFMSIYSHSIYWVKPAFGNKPSEIPERSAAVFFKNKDGSYTYIMTAVGKQYKTYLRGEDSKVVINLYSQYPSKKINSELSFIVGHGNSIHQLANGGALAMCEFMNNGLKLRSEKEMPEIFEYFGWCSWDAFQIRVNHKGLVEKAREFSDKNVSVRYAIIDDMWGDAPNLKTVTAENSFGEMVKIMHASSLSSFEGDKERFPYGLAEAVADIKKNGIENVGLWFPTTGYWYGLTEGGEAYEMQKDNVEAAEGGRIVAIPKEEEAFRYFDIFCKKAKDFGCDFVKIDNQSCHYLYRRMHHIGESSRNLQLAIDKAAFKHFGGALINCMGMPAECMLNRPDSAVSRCSDDFTPESKEWFAKNILECAYNGLLQGRFYFNDWDMWWTDDAQAEKNAICHAISGGPIYVSDKLGRTNPEVLRPLMFDDGRLLRLSDSAMPTEDCVIGDPRENNKPFKIKNSFNGGAAVAAFNITVNNNPVNGTVSAENAGLKADKTYLYYEYFSGDFGFVGGDEEIDVYLENDDKFAYYTFIETTKNKPLFLGRTDKLNGYLAIISQNDNSVTLYEGGDFAYISDEDYAVFEKDGTEIKLERYGLIVSGTCKKENKVLNFIRYDS